MGFKLPQIPLPEINISGVFHFLKTHKIATIGATAALIAGIGGLTYYQSYQAKKAAAELAASVDYSLKALTLDQLEGGKYYIKDGDTYYEVAAGLMYSTGEQTTIPTAAAPNERIVMYGADYQQIPTLYKDTQLIYKSSDFNNPSSDGTVAATPTDYYLERFTDEGWSIGIRGLTNEDNTKYKVSVVQTSFYPSCSVLTNLSLTENADLILDKINGVPITENVVSSVGTITGLSEGQTYTIDAYIGTNPVGGEVTADTHMFASFELYDLTDYELDAAGYAIVTMPDDMWSGYYYINGVGMFRYINNYKAYGNTDVEYNTAYYLGKDANGNIITNPAPAVDNTSSVITTDGTTDATSSDTELEVDETDPFTYHYKVTIDNQQKSMNISIEYSEAMTYVDSDNDGEYEILTASSGAIIGGASTPAAVLISPSGQRYTMTNMGAVMDGAATSLSDMADSQTEDTTEVQAANSLNATIDNPETGTWTVDITGMYARVFTLSTSYTGSSTNMVVKDGTQATTMTVYVPENLTDAVFKMTWDEIGHTGTFKVTNPDGKTAATNARDNNNSYTNPDCVLLEQYGEVDLLLGEAVAGEYKITITGEALGHVYWNYIDRSEGDSSSVETDTTTEATTSEVSETIDNAETEISEASEK